MLSPVRVVPQSRAGLATCLAIALLLIAYSGKQARGQASCGKPNIILILADDSSRYAVIKRLFATLLDLQKETGDSLDLRAIYPGL